MREDWVEIGTIVAPQGLRGEVRIQSSSDFPERFEKAGKRGLQAPNGGEIREIQLLNGRYIPGKSIYIVRLSGVDDRTSAEALRGYTLFADKNDRPRLAGDEYHVSDLVNLEVYHHLTGEKVGVITDIFSAGNDVLEVRLLDGEERTGEGRSKALIPFVKAIVPVVDLARKRVEIDPPAGLLDLDRS
ncbi:ribosome maturation factor RimM [Pannus brasiliensis CCIBt3594]|uniref:Ribosome maturation factor RimM n=1 Tax=Pannus brasiliensis CCIBt3594 TaxID=1427578 RepID=A0AAW9QRP6_9CHRO